MPGASPIRRKRVKRYDIEGHAHFLTFSCLGRQPFLSRDRARRWFLEAVEAAREKQPFDLWAWVIMPEHVHMLVLPHRDVTTSAILSAVKRPVTVRAVAWLERNAPAFLPQLRDSRGDGSSCYRFWLRGGGYDRNIWTAEELHEKIHYIHANPVRRGLVDRPGDWPWSSWRAWEHEIDDPIKIDRESLPPLES